MSRAFCASSGTLGNPAGDGFAAAPEGLLLGAGSDESGGSTTALQLLSTRVFEISMPPFASVQR